MLRGLTEMEADSQYADIDGRALYNTVLGGMALDGIFFTSARWKCIRKSFKNFNHIYDHVKPIRQRWFGCARPPNTHRPRALLRGHYVYTRVPVLYQYVRG